MLGETASAWAAATETGRISTEGRLGLRLAATHATQTAAEVATAMYRAGGAAPSMRRRRCSVASATPTLQPST